MTLRGAQITQDQLAPTTLYAQKLSELNLLLNNGKISQDTFNSAVGQLQAPQLSQMIDDFGNLGKQIDSMAAGAVSRLSSSFNGVIAGTQKVKDAMKQFGLAVVQMIAEMIIKMTIALPIAMALKAALSGITGGIGGLFGLAGGGEIAAFAGGGTLTVPGAAAGMNFKVPGGVSMTDNMMMPIALAAGERVKVEPNRYGESGSSGGGDSTLFVHGISPKQYYTGDVLRSLVENMIQFQRDGGKIQLA
jgi:hypothetical protein